MVKHSQNRGASADAPSRWLRPPAPSPTRRSHREPFEECWAERAESEGHSGERKGTLTKHRGGAVFLLGRHGGVGLDLVDNFVQVDALRYLAIYLANGQTVLILSWVLPDGKVIPTEDRS